jgi:Co-chaperonin GroES (HSP10)
VTTATKVAIKPLEDRILVQASEAETTTASGLVIPDTAKEKPQEGKVIAVAPVGLTTRATVCRST